MDNNVIYLTEQDYKRLVDLIQVQRQGNGTAANIGQLGEELKRAKLVASDEIPANVITMNSKVLLRDLQKGTEMEITLVYPKDADISSRKISILAPVGTAIIGCKEGDVVEWPVPSGTINYKIDKILFQPEATGNYTL
ncbi:nucleoside diphosphate kinase regulator [Pontibacter mangrovi]|uniref:Nucleoside diphosphate kinase regulator n=1 Tax=Pontibacter mangrovi TaxID=2589816 RepID=A0A501WC93_9BACT|nr:nucleoside diphosphate kinase regulator [Pontibacter mangrovi]TPE46010.1 nucleoside diphosphate kinase regulator [Pontibacter mangrovi]